MADGFTFELVSPEKLLLSGDAEIVSVPGVEGDMGILPNHAHPNRKITRRQNDKQEYVN